MIGQENRNEDPSRAQKSPEARYSYYRRCQIFRRNGEQCKAPAETGALICHAHTGQLAMAVRRERERGAVLAEAVAEMRRRGRPEFEAKDLFMDFNGIQVTLAVMARALIVGKIDCKTAGRLVVQLQIFSKLLWMMHAKSKSTTEARRHGKEPRLPQSADNRGLNKETDSITKEYKEAREVRPTMVVETAAKIVVMRNTEQTHIDAERAHGPPGWASAA